MSSRRGFLRQLAVLGGAPWLLPLVGCESGRGATLDSRRVALDPSPQRLIVFFTLHGTVYDNWKIHPPGTNSTTRWSRDLGPMSVDEFSPILGPLHPWRDRLSVYDGLSLVSAETERNNVRHIIGSLHALTGAPTAVVSSTTVGSAPSIDQVIANAIARPDQFRSVEVTVGEPLVEVITRAAQQVLPLQKDPALLQQQLFGTGGAEVAAAGQAEVFAASEAWYGEFAKGLSSGDRERLEIHRSLLRDLELRAQGLATRNCEVPVTSEAPALTYSDKFDDFRRLAVTAFACDLTRVATFYMSTQPAERVGAEYSGEMHQEYAHDVYISPEAATAMSDYSRRHAEDFASLLTALDAIPEGDGSLLDHTTVVWCGELADGAHGYERWPVVVAGGQGLRKGRYEHWPSDTPFAGYLWDGSRSASMGVPHEKFLTTLARSMGVDIDRMPITKIEGIDGVNIDCTGVLDGVLG